jgi:hypothetical protein
MITGKEFAEKSLEKKKVNDFITGWYAREEFGNMNEITALSDEELRLSIISDLDKIEKYVRRMYADHGEQFDYVCHDDPLGNIGCIKNHAIGKLSELTERRNSEQFLLFG